MTLSIVIVNYNTKELLKKCLESIDFKPAEIIVVDNGSTDGSVDFLKKKKGIKVVFNKRNQGFARAVNQAVKTARGDNLLLLNSDTIVKKGSLKRLVEFAEKTPDAGVVGPRLLNKDGSLQPSCYRFPSVLGAVREFWLGRKGWFSKYAPKGKRPAAVDALVGAAFLITARARERVGLLDERYFFYFEDLDYCRRVWRAGLRVYYLPEAEIIHLHGASGRKMGRRPNQWLTESSKIYHGAFKHYLINLIIWLGQKWQRLRSLF